MGDYEMACKLIGSHAPHCLVKGRPVETLEILLTEMKKGTHSFETTKEQAELLLTSGIARSYVIYDDESRKGSSTDQYWFEPGVSQLATDQDIENGKIKEKHSRLVRGTLYIVYTEKGYQLFTLLKRIENGELLLEGEGLRLRLLSMFSDNVAKKLMENWISVSKHFASDGLITERFASLLVDTGMSKAVVPIGQKQTEGLQYNCIIAVPPFEVEEMVKSRFIEYVQKEPSVDPSTATNTIEEKIGEDMYRIKLKIQQPFADVLVESPEHVGLRLQRSELSTFIKSVYFEGCAISGKELTVKPGDVIIHFDNEDLETHILVNPKFTGVIGKAMTLVNFHLSSWR